MLSGGPPSFLCPVVALTWQISMRSKYPFFEDYMTLETITKAAVADGRLMLYCGAGVTIDRTGHSWSSLILSLLPERKHRTRPDMPTRSQVSDLETRSPESLASSVVYLLRANSGGGEKLKRALRNRLRAALYQEEGRWQNGRLVEEIIVLAALRSARGADTSILTTNYDTYLELAFERMRQNLPEVISAPGLRVFRAGNNTPVRTIAPNNRDPEEPGAFVDIVYLHGRLPRANEGTVDWPLVLDENSYASTARQVEKTIEEALRGASLALLLGTSLTDTPLVRALSVTPRDGCERLGILLRADFAHSDGANEDLALTLARHRASELGVGVLFPDFPGQVAQLLREVSLRRIYSVARPDEPKSLPYTDRVDAWWTSWATNNGGDPKLIKNVRRTLRRACKLMALTPSSSPFDSDAERFQVELWVREGPVAVNRNLRRWVRSNLLDIEGMAGKASDLERNSYLAPVRAFVDGRPRLLDVEELDGGRHDVEQYTWKSFLCVPILANSATVGVMCLASTRPASTTAMNKNAKTTANLVGRLRLDGSRLLDVGGQ